MKNILNTIKGQGWTLGEFLFRLFRKKDEDTAPRPIQHSQMVSKFLVGDGGYTPSDILTCWMTNPYGAFATDSPQSRDMYSTTTPYTSIRSSANTLLEVPRERCKLGSDTISVVSEVLDLHLEAAWYLLDLIAMRKPRTRDGVQLPSQKSRPSRGVIIHALADLLFCRSDRANLLPIARGVLYFGSSVPVEIMAYNSRIGTMPSYSTIYRNLEGLSTEEASVTRTHGRDPSKAGLLLFDNVQNLARIRDLRVGRENHMNVGMSGLWVEAGEGIDVSVFDLDDKRRPISDNQLLGFLDHEDADITGYLEWLEVLKPKVSALYRATQKLVVPLTKSKKTIPSELKDGLLDFLDQVGQTPNEYIRRKLILQAYLQFHKDPFKSFEILEPQLQVWHTKWTDLIRIFQTHWGRVSGKSTNPSSLGHSAGKIGRAAPSNMKKVEFYPGSQLLYLVLDARMLDCWSLLLETDDIIAYFDKLAEGKELPDFEDNSNEKPENYPDFDDLVATAKILHRTYSTAGARDHAIFDTGTTSAWAKTIPTGSPWVPMDVEDSSVDQKKKKKPSKKKAKPVPPPCKGDFVLAQAIDFFRDAINSRKISFAVAEGNVGRLYECLKYMLFTFAGSTHTNYMAYLLETIINLELESSPGLKEALLLCLLINLTGLIGHFEEGDYVVEFFNRLLEDVVQHKNAQFDDNFIRNVVSRNLRHIAELKLAWRTGTGMAAKSKKHSDPHTNPELRILLKVYRAEELHCRRLGRKIDDRDTDDFAKGIKKLRTGALEKFIRKSLRTRQTKRPANSTPSAAMNNDSDGESEDEPSSDESGDSDAENCLYATRGSMAVDGQLVMDDRDMMLGPEADEELGGMEGKDEAEDEADGDVSNDDE
ncbi:hypothetical protein B0H11DRAFT_2161915 [Mycena galericulata]|nr:hypothetical protein B0H11DRAFT_2161915 [Mycena galericulata]